jgi:hypothetical protein
MSWKIILIFAYLKFMLLVSNLTFTFDLIANAYFQEYLSENWRSKSNMRSFRRVSKELRVMGPRVISQHARTIWLNAMTKYITAHCAINHVTACFVAPEEWSRHMMCEEAKVVGTAGWVLCASEVWIYQLLKCRLNCCPRCKTAAMTSRIFSIVAERTEICRNILSRATFCEMFEQREV